MSNGNLLHSYYAKPVKKPSMHAGHFGTIAFAFFLLLGLTWMSKPQLLDFHKSETVADANVPHYYPYVAAADDIAQPAVLGASTNEGPSIINEDGTVSPVDSGEVLGANTSQQISLSGIKVSSVPDSDAAIKNYLAADQLIEKTPIEDGNFEAALSSNDPSLLKQEISALTPVRDALQKLTVPQGFADLQKIKIFEYDAAIQLLKDFPQMNVNPQLVGTDLEQFLGSEQQLSDAINSVAQKYNLDPDSIGPAGEAAVLSGVVQGANEGLSQAAATVSQQATSTNPSSLGQ